VNKISNHVENIDHIELMKEKKMNAMGNSHGLKLWTKQLCYQAGLLQK
jgi:hypothetical protein